MLDILILKLILSQACFSLWVILNNEWINLIPLGHAHNVVHVYKELGAVKAIAAVRKKFESENKIH